MKRETLFSVATIFANALFLTASNAGPFFQTSDSQGLVSIEAENPDARTTAPGGHEWVSAGASFAGHSGADALQALPDDAVSYVTGDLSLSPRLDYQVNFAAAGTHYVWVRARAPSLSSRAFHVGLDGQEFGSRKYLRAPVSGGYEWVGAKANGMRSTVNVTTLGIHTVNLWMRDSGTVVDKLVLTTDPDFVPTGFGPAETLDTAASDLVPLLPGFERVSDALWDDTAVRKVLHTFAYGGHATDEQIQIWADMKPEAAIAQMLTFDQHNLLLSPLGPDDYDRLDTRDGTLKGLGAFWSSDDPDNGIYVDHRPKYLPHAYNNRVWVRAATSRGLNPFRQKIGFWETNYHMAVNQLAGPTSEQITRYYDDLTNALDRGLPYQDVMTVASLSAAIARQYGQNTYVNGQCRCNEDFAREYHQLFFGILGNDDPFLHETVTIKNAAKALTGIRILRNSKGDFIDSVVFDPEFHYPGTLSMLNVEIGGSSAPERFEQLARYAIAHEESLDSLPVIIIQGLADDNLSDEKVEKIRSAWRSMEEKNLLDFLRTYAISEIFHDEERVKYLTSVDRHLLVVNQMLLNNEENYLDLYDPYGPSSFEDEGVVVFQPEHNVFGGQTGIEASDSMDIFRHNYNRFTGYPSLWYRRTSINRYGREWKKDWASVVPRMNETYQVRLVAEWLWKRFIGDGLKNFGTLERAHVYALLATDQDIGYLVDSNDPNRVLSTGDLVTDSNLAELVEDLAASEMALGSSDPTERTLANRRVGTAINFILATPYIFAQEGG